MLFIQLGQEVSLSPIAILVFLIGFLGLLESRDLLSFLISSEISLLGLNLYIITISFIHGDYLGQLYAVCVLALTAADSSVGLSLLVALYQHSGRVRFACGLLRG